MSGTYSNAPCTEEGYKKFPLQLAILMEFLVISLFYETKIPTMDMKVQVSSNFRRKKKTWRKMKSPSPMRNGRFNTSKCRGKVQKIREETLKGLFSRFLIPPADLFGFT
jgi:hypothetical protein